MYRWCENDLLVAALLAAKNVNSNLGSSFAGTHVTTKDNGGRPHLTASVQKSCQLQAPFNL